MSTQKDTKKTSGERGESGNIKAYTKAKLSGKKGCRPTLFHKIQESGAIHNNLIFLCKGLASPYHLIVKRRDSHKLE